jgi:hypothetical protein
MVPILNQNPPIKSTLAICTTCFMLKQLLQMASFNSKRCLTPGEQLTKNCLQSLSRRSQYHTPDDFFKACPLHADYLQTSFCYFEYLCDCLTNSVSKINCQCISFAKSDTKCTPAAQMHIKQFGGSE